MSLPASTSQHPVQPTDTSHANSPNASNSLPTDTTTPDGLTSSNTSASLPSSQPAAAQTAVFRPVESSTPLDELPDSAFEPTPAEIQAAYLAATGRQQANSVLRTSAMRAKDEARGARPKPSWPTTKIRIKFSDRTQIERIFPSDSRLVLVYAFVRESLSETHRSEPFMLYQPPRSNLPEYPPTEPVRPPHKRSRSPLPPPPATLLEHGLTPSSVLLIRFENDDLNLSTRPAPLLSNLLSHATDLPDPSSVSSQPPASSTASPTDDPSAAPAKPKEKKIPAWLLKGLHKKK